VVAADKLGMLHTAGVTKRFDQGEQPVIGLRLRDKTELRVTPDHRILTDHGWRQAGELEVGARVARARHAGTFGTAVPVTPDQARLLGEDASRMAACIPPAFFAADVSEAVLANLVFGLLESDGYVSREQTRSVHSEQAPDVGGAHHWH
jgi:hypothetical protein